MRLIDDLADLVVIAVSVVAVAIAVYATTGAPPPALSAATRFIAECPAATQYEIWHVGPRRSMQITCEGIAR